MFQIIELVIFKYLKHLFESYPSLCITYSFNYLTILQLTPFKWDIIYTRDFSL